MKGALIAAVVAAVVAAGSAGAALTRSNVRVVRVVGAAQTIPPQGTGFAWASCPGFLKASGGGIVSKPFASSPVELNGSYSLPGNSTWEIAVTNPNSSVATIRATAICVN